MTGVRDDLLSGLPEDVRQLVATPPLTEKKLLELSVVWIGLAPAQARMADVLRLFLITWDPLERYPPRPEGFGTANAGPPVLEVVVYVPVWSLVELATERATTIADVLGAMAGSAVVTAAAHEELVTSGDYPELFTRQALPGLLHDPAAGSVLGPADALLVSPGWEDIGLGAITDIVQHAFGPVDLDRSRVELAAATAQPGCLACAGRRFNFPADLTDSRDRMCPAHRKEANGVIRRRLARANASNPDGWHALIGASNRLELPHLPGGLATKLAGGRDEAMYVAPEPEELARRAQLVVEAATWFPGRARDLAVALGQEPELAGQLPNWLVNLVRDLGRAGLGAEAAAVGDALSRVDPDERALHDGEVAVALAEAGLAEEARARVEANLTSWPDDFSTRIVAGDALAALGDVDGAESHFATALTMAEHADDFVARSDAVDRLRGIGRLGSQYERGRPTIQRRQARRNLSRSQRRRRR